VRITTRGLSDVYITHIRIVPGGHSGWHSHPGPSFVTVKAGTATFYQGADMERTPYVYPAGIGFVEDAGHVHIVRNEGDTDLELVVMQLIPRGADRRIEEERPPWYDFG
jgi:quercetin dioxygenase-like cupin family protein